MVEAPIALFVSLCIGGCLDKQGLTWTIVDIWLTDKPWQSKAAFCQGLISIRREVLLDFIARGLH